MKESVYLMQSKFLFLCMLKHHHFYLKQINFQNLNINYFHIHQIQ